VSAMEQIAAKKICLKHAGWKKGNYRKTVYNTLARWLAEEDEETGKTEPDYSLANNIFYRASKYLPDLYKIDEERKIIGLMEIEDFSKLKADKLKAYADFWFDADCYEISIEVYTADRYGRDIRYLDLFPAFCHATEEANKD